MYLSLLGYNKTAWLAAGLPEPGPNPTWDTLIAAAEQFATGSTPARPVYGLVDNGQGLLVLLHALEKNQAKLFDVPPAQVQFDQPPVRAALQRVRELVQRSAVFAYAAQKQPITSFEDIARLVREQRLFIWPTDAIQVNPADPRLGFAVGYVAFPQLAQPVQLAGQEGYLISAGTQHPEAAWEWLSFLSQQQVGTAALPKVPARRSLAETSGVLKRTPAEFATVARSELARTPTSAAPVADGTWLALTNKPLLAAAGTLPIAQALTQAQAELTSALAAAPPPIDTKPVVVAPPVIVPDNVTSIDFVTQFGDQQVRLGAAASQSPNIRLNDPSVVQAARYYITLVRQSVTPNQVSGYRAGMLVWSDLISSGQTVW